MSRLAAVAAVLVVLGLAGCGGEPEARQGLRSSARGYHPEQFPDIPLPPGFVLDPDRDQLAVAVGGGLLRRFDVGMVQKFNAKPQSPTEIMTWYEQVLPNLGWIPDPSSGQQRVFHRHLSPEVSEILRVHADTSGMSTRVRLRLEPAPLAPTTP